MRNLRIFLFCLVLFVVNLLLPHTVFAQLVQPQSEEKIEAVVTNIREEKEIEINGKKQPYQKLELLVMKGSNKGETIAIDTGGAATIRKYAVGDKLLVTATKNVEGKKMYYATDYIRRDALYWLFALFVGITIFIGGKRGAASLLGMGISFAMIFVYILPEIHAGKDPVFTAIIASMFIIPATFFLSHGINKKTAIAIVGTLLSLIITGILASVFVGATRLSGLSSEEAMFLSSMSNNQFNLHGLLLAGIIIGVVGILDDITISQAAIVYQLKHTAPHLSFSHLYFKAMDIGKDHIASVVNTLVLVYTGAAFPLLLLFSNNPLPFTDVINYEMLAEEIVRTLVASIGLILAVPITTFLMAYSLHKNKNG